MSFNIWQPQGQYISVMPGFVGNPSILFDTNPVILTGNTNVFKLWVGLDSNGSIFYYESLTGLPNSWTAYSGNPITPTNGAFFPTLYKVGSTYYLWGNSGFGTPIQAFTSTDGVTFTLQNATALPLGSAGAWDSSGVFQINLVDVISGTWYAYYSGYNGTTFQQGLITSTDGTHWTKSPGNPLTFVSSGNVGNSCFLKANGQYYMYAAFFDFFPPGISGANYRTGRWSSPTPSGPWTRLMWNGKPVPTYYLTTPGELNQNNGFPVAGPNDQRIVVANGNVYLFYTYTRGGGNEAGVNSAVAFGVTPDQLTATYEGVQNVPFTGVPELNLVTLGSDIFQRANVNPIGGNWTPVTAGDTAKIVSNLVNPSAVATPGDSYWNAVAWPNDQWSQITAAVEASDSFCGVDIRGNTGGPPLSYYRLIPTGGFGASSSLAIQKYVSAAFTELATLTFTFSAGDTFMMAAIGNSILSYWNDQLVWNQTDSSLTAGVAGFEIDSPSATTNAAISAWSGGTFQNPPPPVTNSISHFADLFLAPSAGTSITHNADLFVPSQKSHFVDIFVAMGHRMITRSIEMDRIVVNNVPINKTLVSSTEIDKIRVANVVME